MRHVVHIGIDGLHPCFVEANVSNIMNRLAAEGSYTIDKGRAVIPTWSLPSWAATLCSIPIESTGILDNFWLPQWLGYDQDITPVTGPNVNFPCIFDVLQRTDADVHTAFFHNWNLFEYFASTGAPGRLDKDQYCEPRFEFSYDECDLWSAMNASAYLEKVVNTTERSYTFVYLMEVDNVGHDAGWCTDTYMQAVSDMDDRVGWC